MSDQLAGGIFFLLWYLYAWLVVDPQRIFSYFQGYAGFFFSDDWSFFQEHLARPGGLLEYAAGLLSHGYCFGWAGAIVMTATAWLACLGADAVMRTAGRSRPTIWRYAPAAILLVLYDNGLHVLGPVLSLLAGLWCFVLYQRAVPQNTWKRLAVLLVMCVALFYVVGARGLLFPVLVAVYELLIARRALMAAAAMLGGAGIPWLASKSPGAFSAALSQNPLADLGIPAEQTLWALALLLFFPAALGARPVADGLRTVFRRMGKPPGRPEAETIRPDFSSPWLQAALAIAATAAAAWFCRDAHHHSLLEVDHAAAQQRWDAALQAARRMPHLHFDLRCNRNVLRALVQTGRVGDELFCYPQVAAVELFNRPEKHPEVCAWIQESRLSFDVGLVNNAERCAYEALAEGGSLPPVLEQLAAVNVVKGRSQTAQVFLRALERNPFYRATAGHILRRLEKDPSLQDDARVGEARSLMPDKDVPFETPQEDCLLALLEKDRHNRKALDLLLAYWLLAGQPDRVAANLRRLGDCGYDRVPRHCQEALLEQRRGRISFPVVAGRLPREAENAADAVRIDPEIVRRADLLDNILRRSPNWEAAFQDAAAAGLGNTYRFYRAFGLSGV